MLLFTTQIENGMRYLDSVDPGWERRVDVDELSMWSGDACVLGQTQGSYDDYVAKHDLSPFWIEAHGFLMGPVPSGLDWVQATMQWNEEWKAAIRARQQQPAPQCELVLV